jgi:uncharacterized protein (TIGR00725 family)
MIGRRHGYLNGDRQIIAVIGTSDASGQEAGDAEEIGRRLAEAGAILVCGGGGGIMASVCRGAKTAGGLTIGILAGADAHDCNEFVDVPIATGMGELRNMLVVRSGHAAIAIGGGYGTLSEVGFALKIGRAVIGLNTFKIGLNGDELPGIVEAATPEEAVRLALEAARRHVEDRKA